MPTEEIEDCELIALFASGDSAAFETLYGRYRRQLYGYLCNMTGNCSEADELFEETWLKVIDRLSCYRDHGKFSAWLFRLARNLFIDRLRRNAKFNGAMRLDDENVPDLAGADSYEPDRTLANDELRAVIDRAVAQLPADQREVFLLRQQDISFRDIAAMQKCSINTALGRMQYALKNLRKTLENIDNGGLVK
ncbi:MAG: sigma-70 family RNA polymerase sigma factor [Victivallaceae bacterium]|nr:sigma-70 family RNA polymerase sigma factor [Victivallaceae bacterium]